MKKIATFLILSTFCVLGAFTIAHENGLVTDAQAFIDHQNYQNLDEIKQHSDVIITGETIEEITRKTSVGSGHYLYEDKLVKVKVLDVLKGELQKNDTITVVEPTHLTNHHEKSTYYLKKNEDGNYILTGKGFGKHPAE